MNDTTRTPILAATMLIVLGGPPALAQQANMTFFVTSTPIGKGADLGGIAGADQHCQQLAQAAGAGARTWHAYMSTQAANGQPAVTPAIASATGPGRTPKASGRANLDECTAPTTISPSRPTSRKRAS